MNHEKSAEYNGDIYIKILHNELRKHCIEKSKHVLHKAENLW